MRNTAFFPIDKNNISGMVRAIIATRDDEIGCDECFEHVDQYAEMLQQGQDAAQVLPLVKAHLDMCGNCREEFEALMEALEALV